MEEPENQDAVLQEASENEEETSEIRQPSHEEEEEEEEECRVCRGPAEEGNPLFSPCKCSGSIGLVHQECLVSWLDVTRGDGRCELCKTKFRFDPQYAENTPARLSAHEVVLGLTNRFIVKWLPLTFRILLALTCWLVLAPFFTACLYHGWMHRPSSIVTRLRSQHLIPGDIVSGAIIAALVIISFLSIMSFVDFLRVHWQQPEEVRQQRRNARNHVEPVEAEEPDPDHIDNTIFDQWQEIRQQTIVEYENDSDDKVDDASSTGNAILGEENARNVSRTEAAAALGQMAQEFGQEVNRQAWWGVNNDVHDEHDSDDSDFVLEDNEHDEDDEFIVANNNQRPPPEGDNAQRPPDQAGFDPLDPMFQDDQADMEINVALDELLGIRGHPSTLIRNLLWLLAFNATYLGFFAFVPRTIGSALYMATFNTTACTHILKAIPFVYSEDQNVTTIQTTIRDVNQVSEDLSTTFRLPDFAMVTLGYFFMAFTIALLRFVRKFSSVFSRRFILGNGRPNNNQRQPGMNGNWQDIRVRAAPNDQDIAVDAEAIGMALDGAVAIVKVGVLLFLKMFVLPQILGLVLDASTVSLFGQTLTDRVTFAGSDLFSFLLVHWVAGITFMLLVTVFLLQLREVMHPDILSRVIRPQEPHPDLLGNLMNETVATHVKRMVLSLAIYVPILILHVTLPVQVLLRAGSIIPLSAFHLNFWHAIKPEMQIPLELIIFHLSMLALLEKHKNAIGQLQHHWLKAVCSKFGLTEYLLPLSVETFELVGTKAVFHMQNGEKSIHGFWYELLRQNPDNIVKFVEEEIDKSNTAAVEVIGEVKDNGKRVYSASTDVIKIPNDEKSEGYSFLSTSIGPFRLNLRAPDDKDVVVEFWRERRGDAIERPPEGWDDLGAGGAFVQGRWAWSKEKRSNVEESVASRRNLKDTITRRRPVMVLVKIAAVVVLSWIALAFSICSFISVPFAVGRILHSVFRVNPVYVHDPFAFVLGGLFVFPLTSLLVSGLKLDQGGYLGRISYWASSFRVPPRSKFLTLLSSAMLWCAIAPIAFGLSYDISIIKSPAWFHGSETLLDTRTVLLSWLTGLVALNAWAYFAYFSVFTLKFWSNIGNGMLEPPLDENGNPIPVRNNLDDIPGNRSDWQGKQGRVAHFFRVWKASSFDWDWEQVDKTVLLDDFAVPIARQLASTLVGSLLSFMVVLNVFLSLTGNEGSQIALPLFGVVERGLFYQAIFRCCMVSHIGVQLCSSFRGQLNVWLESAHKAAKDARYLVGEILVNYQGEN